MQEGENKMAETNVEKKTFEQVSEEFMDEWYSRLKEGDPEKMADLYTDPCTLFATFSGEVITDRAGVKEYFKKFMAMNPVGKTASKDTGEELAAGVYAIGIKYDFTKPDGTVVDARNTMNLVTRNEKLMIRVHHSSETPKPKEH